MLYQKGEKLKELQQTIKEIPIRSDLKQSNFVMSKKEFKKFELPILKLFNNLNNVLFNTLTNEKTEDENRGMVYRAVGDIILYLDENNEHDLRDYFYEEKLAVYEKMFVILVRDELYKRYKEYTDLLRLIPNAFLKKRKESESKFPKIPYLIDVYREITEDIENAVYDSTVMYLNHPIEMIYQEISDIIKNQCEMEFLNPDVLPNHLRQLIYLLKSELPIVFEENEDDEE